MCLIGHNSYKGCRYCDICGIYMGHVYFPTMPPIEKKNKCTTYDSDNLPMQNHEQFKERIQQLSIISSNKELHESEVKFGMYKLFFLYYK